MFDLTNSEAVGTCTNSCNIGTSDTTPSEFSLPVAFNISTQSKDVETHTQEARAREWTYGKGM